MLIPTDVDQAKMHTARILQCIHQEQQEAHRRRQLAATVSRQFILQRLGKPLD